MNMEVLPLRHVTPREPQTDCATRPVAEQILRAFRMMFAYTEVGPEHEALDTQLVTQASALAGASGRAAIAQISDAVVNACRGAVAAVARRQQLRRQDIESLVAVVRATVDSLATGHAESSLALGESTARLESLQTVPDFDDLRRRLASEVSALRQIARDRDRDHDRTVTLLRDQLTTAEQQLCLARAEALVDPLTEVVNRRGFDSALADRIKTMDPAMPLILALFDVDYFKGMNDRYGHMTGDAVLRHVALTIRGSVRQDDVVARIGGDEFALIASGLTLKQAEPRMRAILHKIGAESVGAEDVLVSVSCGVAEYSAGDTVQTLISRSDGALNDAKAYGKNRVVARDAPYIRNLLRHRR
jgi:diguanylate cyclase